VLATTWACSRVRQTFFDDGAEGRRARHRQQPDPAADRRKLAPDEFTIHAGKVYVQMRGPRFETKAEIRIVQALGRRDRHDRGA
jgi:5'-methylthioadenosine phosphorylase